MPDVAYRVWWVFRPGARDELLAPASGAFEGRGRADGERERLAHQEALRAIRDRRPIDSVYGVREEPVTTQHVILDRDAWTPPAEDIHA